MIADGYTDLPPGKIASIVTYLEMRHPPAPNSPAENSQWTLSRHNSPDLDWYRKLFRAVGEEWLWFSRLQMGDKELRSVIHNEAVDVFALEVEGAGEKEEKGILELDRREMPDIELAFIGVTADLIGKGAGRFLLSKALDIAWSHHPERVLVHTCTLDHRRALDFYRRAGFVPYKRAIEIAPDPRLDGTLSLSAAKHHPSV